MKEYIFYTTEGYTEAPNDENVDNCQVLGRAKGNDVEEAQQKLLKENPWIIETKFDPSEFMAEQILTSEQRNDILSLINYLWIDEMRHFEESNEPSNHIFNAIKRLKDICE